MDLGVDQSEHWPKWFQIGESRYQVEYTVRQPTQAELRESGTQSHIWAAVTTIGDTEVVQGGQNAFESVVKLASEVSRRTGSSKRFIIDLPLDWTELQRTCLRPQSWFR